MQKDPVQTLIAQFTSFIVDTEVTLDDWKLVTTEYLVYEIAMEQERFVSSWRWNDEDRLQRTNQFLNTLYERDGETALALMKRMYDLADGADEDDFRRYPALQSFEGERADIAGSLPTLATTTDSFLNISHTTDDFYDELVTNINQCYRIGVYDGTFVLTRKLLENLIIDLLRNEYGTSYLRMYYIPEQRRFRNFSTLLDGFKYKLGEFQSYANGLDNELISDIRQFKNTADSETHSIVSNLTTDEIADLGVDAEHAAKVMFRTFRNMD